MENEQSRPGTSLLAEQPPRRSRRLRRALIVSVAAGVAAGAAVGGVLMLLPSSPGAKPPVPGSGPQALTAVNAGAPAALPDLAALIGQQEKHVRTHPQDAPAWAVLGTSYVEQGRRTADAADFPRAERALRTSLRVAGENSPQSAPALGGMAALANARRDFAEAKRWGEQALEAEPKRWTTYPLLIDAYTGLGDYKAARQTLEKLMGLKVDASRRPAVMAQAAAVYRDRGWREDAAAQLADASAAARTPTEQAVYLEQAGQLAWERGEREDALRHFEAALRLDPGQAAALAGRGRALAALGRTQEALNAYQEALANQPTPQYALELGELYESLGQRPEARVQYDLLRVRVAQDTAGGVDDELVLGQFEADHGNPQEAVQRLEAEWERQPGIEVADALGWALNRAGDAEKALQYAEIATDKVNGGGVRSALYAYHRGMIERELELDGPARRHLEEALRISPYFSPLQAPAARTALRELGEPSAEEPVFDDAKAPGR
ncbi:MULTISPECIES: tetratricopeptide repeat protein [Streptomyces]|uniref:tetratricopeptide repeat protein n=1 Tax=Streptomyces TaxID=1883 RepID=UPI00292E89D8|nr:tetratricopeptide repeat protein [Streptomyces sp. NEAU-HV9]